MNRELENRVEEIADAMQKSYAADIDFLTRCNKAYQERIAELEEQLILVSRELASTDNADRYYRGFNDGYDHANSIKETNA